MKTNQFNGKAIYQPKGKAAESIHPLNRIK